MRRAAAAFALAALTALPVAAFGQGMTLADMRTELDGLRAEFQTLRAQLVASGAAGYQAAGGDAAIDRMAAIELRLARLTDKTEQLQNRITRVVAESARQMDDLEFRLCEMDEGCDLSALTTPDTGYLPGGTDLSSAAPSSGSNGKAPTAAEQADFDAARRVLAEGDFLRAAEMFGKVAETHAGGPLTAEALYLRGQALAEADQTRAAAAAWLEGFAADPDGPRAAESLLGIAQIIQLDGDPTAACLYLAEIPARFPGTPQAAQAETQMSRLLCGANDLDAADLDATGVGTATDLAEQ